MTHSNATSPQSGEFERATFPAELFRCAGCGNRFEEDELKHHTPSGFMLCSDCLDAWMESDKKQDEENETLFI